MSNGPFGVNQNVYENTGYEKSLKKYQPWAQQEFGSLTLRPPPLPEKLAC